MAGGQRDGVVRTWISLDPRSAWIGPLGHWPDAGDQPAVIGAVICRARPERLIRAISGGNRGNRGRVIPEDLYIQVGTR